MYAGAHGCADRGAAEAHWMAEAAAASTEVQGAAIIDINMGCPRQEGDERLLRLGADGATPTIALSLIEAVVGAVKVPGDAQDAAGHGTMRCETPPDLARRAEAGRTCG